MYSHQNRYNLASESGWYSKILPQISKSGAYFIKIGTVKSLFCENHWLSVEIHWADVNALQQWTVPVICQDFCLWANRHLQLNLGTIRWMLQSVEYDFHGFSLVCMILKRKKYHHLVLWAFILSILLFSLSIPSTGVLHYMLAWNLSVVLADWMKKGRKTMKNKDSSWRASPKVDM